jgi:2-C-methyl-D-erythritol 4-phosphate cytidylyltransferase
VGSWDESGIAALIMAGGTGERFGRPGGKQLALLHGRPVLSWSLSAFEGVIEVGLIVVVCPEDRETEYRREAVHAAVRGTPVRLASSGPSRQESVANGLAMLPEETQIVVVHDGARPLVTPKLIAASLVAFNESGADGLVVGYPSSDTLKVVEDGEVISTPDRSPYWAVQTPQIFTRAALVRAHQTALEHDWSVTDDASLVERCGGRVVVFEGPRDNIKITNAEDLQIAEAALQFRADGGV